MYEGNSGGNHCKKRNDRRKKPVEGEKLEGMQKACVCRTEKEIKIKKGAGQQQTHNSMFLKHKETLMLRNKSNVRCEKSLDWKLKTIIEIN